ncbi:MAG: type I-E CRISPR-associated protein Cse1/CasA [Planctomycetes bacterium]|nr:type I-E CRISPR-associated protein Cse1/CasA [Planctomycetota bacterium]MCW8134420.1 type I-E CRISPR-associated protein Cse1/CasA [Planctomycetota bacterium]
MSKQTKDMKPAKGGSRADYNNDPPHDKTSGGASQHSFNLLHKPWIPVLWRAGRAERVGIKSALTSAGKIRQIAASNPMDNVALLRFLLAVLLWCKPNAQDELTKLPANAPGVPENWLTNLNPHTAAFELLGPGPRFYQDSSLRGKRKQRPIGDLVSEFPTETKVNHLRHAVDKQYGLCPACCALGMVRHCSFANYLGSGYTSGINGGAPTYVNSHKASLAATIAANLPLQAAAAEKPPWLSSDRPQNVSPISAFAWRPRGVWLGEPQEDRSVCAYCGETESVISQHSFAGGWDPPAVTHAGGKKFWDNDPHLLLVQSNARESGDDEDQGLTILAFLRPERPVDQHSKHWRRVVSALASTQRAASVVGGVTTQSGLLYQDSVSLQISSLRAPLPDIQADTLKSLKKSLDTLESNEWAQERKHPETQSALTLQMPEVERQVRAAMGKQATGQAAATATPLDAEADKKFLRDIYQPVVERVVDATAKGSPLRRRDAKHHALALLRKKIDKIVDKANQPAVAAADGSDAQDKSQKPAKAKRARKKKGDA